MKLAEIATVWSGYLSRGRIQASESGSHSLVQARDVNANDLSCDTICLIRFTPTLSPSDCVLSSGDILFMARGSRNYAVLLERIPELSLAAGCFFVVRVTSSAVLPGYVAWYINQPPIEHYLLQNTGRSVHMPVVQRAVLENMPIPVPPLETQKQIAALDALCREEQRLLEDLKQKRKILLATACLRAADEGLEKVTL